jgi:hypothetical protein
LLEEEKRSVTYTGVEERRFSKMGKKERYYNDLSLVFSNRIERVFSNRMDHFKVIATNTKLSIFIKDTISTMTIIP